MEAAGLHLFTSISINLGRMRMVMVVVILAVQLSLFTKFRVLMWTRGVSRGPRVPWSPKRGFRALPLIF